MRLLDRVARDHRMGGAAIAKTVWKHNQRSQRMRVKALKRLSPINGSVSPWWQGEATAPPEASYQFNP
jgi:hypothetical protein